LKKILYIIPGWEDNCTDEQYQRLGDAAKNKGYEVIFHNVDWKKPLSSQIFAVPEEAVVFGFSLGAILAWLVAQKYDCRLLILASMTPHYSFGDNEIKKALIELAGEEFVNDVINNLNSKNKSTKQITMYGALEEEPGDVIVPETEHELNKNYIEAVSKLL